MVPADPAVAAVRPLDSARVRLLEEAWRFGGGAEGAGLRRVHCTRNSVEGTRSRRRGPPNAAAVPSDSRSGRGRRRRSRCRSDRAVRLHLLPRRHRTPPPTGRQRKIPEWSPRHRTTARVEQSLKAAPYPGEPRDHASFSLCQRRGAVCETSPGSDSRASPGGEPQLTWRDPPARERDRLSRALRGARAPRPGRLGAAAHARGRNRRRPEGGSAPLDGDARAPADPGADRCASGAARPRS